MVKSSVAVKTGIDGLRVSSSRSAKTMTTHMANTNPGGSNDPVWREERCGLTTRPIRDFLNFRCVADIAAETIIQAGGQPLSMGVSGGWGVGKSSMLKLISDALNERSGDRYLFVEFNAWLYQGYDDARAALPGLVEV